jgi:nucleoside permease NupC
MVGGDGDDLLFLSLMLEAVRASQMSVSFKQITWHCIAEGCRLQVSILISFLNTDLQTVIFDRLCGLVVGVADYKHRGPGFDSRALLRIFLRELGLERGPLSLVIG